MEAQNVCILMNYTIIYSINVVHKCDKLAKKINPYSRGIDFSRQNVTSVDSRFSHCESKNISNGRRPIT